MRFSRNGPMLMFCASWTGVFGRSSVRVGLVSAAEAVSGTAWAVVAAVGLCQGPSALCVNACEYMCVCVLPLSFSLFLALSLSFAFTGVPPCLVVPARAVPGLQLLRVGSYWAGFPYVSVRVVSELRTCRSLSGAVLGRTCHACRARPRRRRAKAGSSPACMTRATKHGSLC